MRQYAKPVAVGIRLAAGFLLGSATMLLILTAFSPVKRIELLRIASGSMEPAIPAGSVALAVKSDPLSLTENDVITFVRSSDAGTTTVTHRIVAVRRIDGTAEFVTKGDANATPDVDRVPVSAVRGKIVWTVPYLGYVAQAAKTPVGYVWLILVPAIAIIAVEAWSIAGDVETYIRRRRTSRAGQQPFEPR